MNKMFITPSIWTIPFGTLFEDKQLKYGAPKVFMLFIYFYSFKLFKYLE